VVAKLDASASPRSLREGAGRAMETATSREASGFMHLILIHRLAMLNDKNPGNSANSRGGDWCALINSVRPATYLAPAASIAYYSIMSHPSGLAAQPY
jgi:hypothetical protein